MAQLPEADAAIAARVEQARAEGKVLRLVGVIEEGGACKVKIDAVDGNDPLFKVKNGENALAFYSRYYQPIPLVLRGYGAGNDVTVCGRVCRSAAHTVMEVGSVMMVKFMRRPQSVTSAWVLTCWARRYRQWMVHCWVTACRSRRPTALA
ncbi:hypothetical protein WDV93_07420 [Pantoea ananatis]